MKQGYGHVFSHRRGTRDRNDAATNKVRSTDASTEEIDWSSIVPSPERPGVTSLQPDEAFSEISRRVRRECQYLCLLPSQESSNRSNRDWLKCASTLVVSCLNLESPNPIGWDRPDEGIIDRGIGFPFFGVFSILRGPQPWQATRTLIANIVYDLLEAEGLDDWVTSEERWKALYESSKFRIEQYLLRWNAGFGADHNSDLLQQYTKSVWDRFKKDYIIMLQKRAAAIVPIHALSERYVCIVASKLAESLPKVLTIQESEIRHIDQNNKSTEDCRHILQKTVSKLRYCYFPLLEGEDVALENVCNIVWKRLVSMYPTQLDSAAVIDRLLVDASSTNKIASVLNDLEQDNGCLTDLNGLLRVRIYLPKLVESSQSNGVSAYTSVDRSSTSNNSINSEFNTSSKITVAAPDRQCDWELSAEKKVNARVYASCNGDCYWGHIITMTKIQNDRNAGDENEGSDKNIHRDEFLYTVIFEDGDVREKLTNKQIITEVEYIKVFNKKPPSPHSSRRASKRARTVEGQKRLSGPWLIAPLTDDNLNRNYGDDANEISFPNGTASVVNTELFQNTNTLSLQELNEVKCYDCVLCQMPDCGRCHSCRQNEQERSRRCCVRKMCCKIPTKLKSQPALGFPDKNWRFVFDHPLKTMNLRSTTRSFSLPGLRITSPDGRQFLSLETAFASVPHACIPDAISLVTRFLSQVGSLRYVSFTGHFLVDKKFCVDFTSSSGRSITLYGAIVGCMRSGEMKKNEENHVFIIQYNNDVLEIARSMGIEARAIQIVSAEFAWGSVIAFERKTNCNRKAIVKIDQSTPCETWIVPDIRIDEVVLQTDGTKVPQLTIVARGYKFLLRAKLVAGRYGVFITCTQLQEMSLDSDSEEEIYFKPGELVDIGVFSPRRDDDTMPLASFILKNYIHSFKCGRWAFLRDEDCGAYDITDKNAELHSEACTQIYPYIRKCELEDFPLIHARLDPSGKVHYLLGIPYRGCWEEFESAMHSFAPLFSGAELETTVANGFNFTNRRHAEKSTMGIIKTFQVEDIIACIKHLNEMFAENSEVQEWSQDIIFRSYKVVRRLKERAVEMADLMKTLRPGGERTDINMSGANDLADALNDLRRLEEQLQKKKDSIS